MSRFSFPLRNMQVVQATSPGDLRINHGEVMGGPVAWWEEQRHSTGPRRNLVLCSTMEIKEERLGCLVNKSPDKGQGTPFPPGG